MSARVLTFPPTVSKNRLVGTSSRQVAAVVPFPVPQRPTIAACIADVDQRITRLENLVRYLRDEGMLDDDAPPAA
ncbi:MAG TPA: hypothetical protein VNB06_05550 [Thermoanaerobaculia bacterium]|nr:hypothetical protein [Thermoanaerobaculia bacterium]